ncbi:MAG: hypothetical protein P4L41_03375 [Flavipsychrobacter sp.]|nr:hypothetical protein [Flavipsychrobacter sp.]
MKHCTTQFFATQTDLGKCFMKNHAKEQKLAVGFYKTGSKKPSITWSQRKRNVNKDTGVRKVICYTSTISTTPS